MRIIDSVKYRSNKYTLKLLERFNSYFPRINYKSNILISANPRGGSTWLASIFSAIPRSYILYEPISTVYMPSVIKLNFSRRQFIPENAQWEQAKIFFHDLFTGSNLTYRMTLHPMSNNRNALQILTGSLRIIKFCRLNLMLPWLTMNFDLRPPIFFIRHPCAVVYSQMRFASHHHEMGSDWRETTFRKPNGPFNEYFDQYAHILKNIKTQEEQLAALWCITNIIPLTHNMKSNNWITVAYESLLLRPEKELRDLFRELGLIMHSNILENINMPSKTTLTRSSMSDPIFQLNQWKTKLNPGQIDRILRVVDHFGLTKYYGDNVEPDYSELYSYRKI